MEFLVSWIGLCLHSLPVMQTLAQPQALGGRGLRVPFYGVSSVGGAARDAGLTHLRRFVRIRSFGGLGLATLAANSYASMQIPTQEYVRYGSAAESKVRWQVPAATICGSGCAPGEFSVLKVRNAGDLKFHSLPAQSRGLRTPAVRYKRAVKGGKVFANRNRGVYKLCGAGLPVSTSPGQTNREPG